MKSNDELKSIVKEKYGEIADKGKTSNPSSCCGTVACCESTEDFADFSENYSTLDGYSPDADYGLGCGLPTEHAHIKEGDTVLDLGSGAGNDVFVASKLVGAEGKVIGIDMTPSMIERANENAQKLQVENVEFRLGEIEHIPAKNEEVDVVISNCVLNLVPDKSQALKETFRILKKSGHFSVSDIVTYGEIPSGLREEAALYAGCVSGALVKEDYLNIIRKAGFENVKVQKERSINLPDDLLDKYLNESQKANFKKEFSGIASITVYGEKPCCDRTTNCC